MNSTIKFLEGKLQVLAAEREEITFEIETVEMLLYEFQNKLQNESQSKDIGTPSIDCSDRELVDWMLEKAIFTGDRNQSQPNSLEVGIHQYLSNQFTNPEKIDSSYGMKSAVGIAREIFPPDVFCYSRGSGLNSVFSSRILRIINMTLQYLLLQNKVEMPHQGHYRYVEKK